MPSTPLVVLFLVSRLLKGVFEHRPSLPKYDVIWDVSVVLRLLRSWQLQSISLKDLTLKLTTLLALASSQRVQTLKAFNIQNLTFQENKCVFVIDSVLKTTRPGNHLSTVVIDEFSEDHNLCPVQHLKLYLNKTTSFRSSNMQLLLSYQRPYQPVSTDTIARWIKTVLGKAGLDNKVFGAHSTRAAVTSAAHKNGVSIDRILAAGGWSNENTFGRFYKKNH